MDGCVLFYIQQIFYHLSSDLTLKVRSLFQKSRFFIYINFNFEDRFLTID